MVSLEAVDTISGSGGVPLWLISNDFSGDIAFRKTKNLVRANARHTSMSSKTYPIMRAFVRNIRQVCGLFAGQKLRMFVVVMWIESVILIVIFNQIRTQLRRFVSDVGQPGMREGVR